MFDMVTEIDTGYKFSFFQFSISSLAHLWRKVCGVSNTINLYLSTFLKIYLKIILYHGYYNRDSIKVNDAFVFP